MDTIPYGYCRCGCGEKAPVAKKTDKAWGHTRGLPKAYIQGHGRVRRSGPRFIVIDAGYDSPCWVWQRSLDPKGYGRVNAEGHLRAHQLFYVKKHGPVPPGLVLHHLCDNPPCVNPDHLQPLTNVENIRLSPKRRQFSSDDIEAIRRSHGAGVSQRAIAKTYGVSHHTIGRVLREASGA